MASVAPSLGEKYAPIVPVDLIDSLKHRVVKDIKTIVLRKAVRIIVVPGSGWLHNDLILIA